MSTKKIDVLDSMLKRQRGGDEVPEIVKSLKLYDEKEKLDVPAAIETLKKVLKEKNIDPAGDALQGALTRVVVDLRKFNPPKAVLLLELQKELSKMKLE